MSPLQCARKTDTVHTAGEHLQMSPDSSGAYTCSEELSSGVTAHSEFRKLDSIAESIQLKTKHVAYNQAFC